MTQWILITAGVSIALAIIFFGCALHAGVCLTRCQHPKGHSDER